MEYRLLFVDGQSRYSVTVEPPTVPTSAVTAEFALDDAVLVLAEAGLVSDGEIVDVCCGDAVAFFLAERPPPRPPPRAAAVIMMIAAATSMINVLLLNPQICLSAIPMWPFMALLLSA
jgi:hypothetical protein